MEPETKDVESFDEDEKEVEEPQKSEEEGTPKKDEAKDEFEKKDEFVSTNKYNQAVRKQREIELEKKRLEKELEDAKKGKPEKKVAKEVSSEKKEVEEVDSFFDDLEDEEPVVEKKVVKPEVPTIDPSDIIDEKLKPVLENLKKREEEDRKKVRTAWFEAHPEYLHNSEEWNGLLEVLDKDINPNSGDDYFEQLNKAHILKSGQTVEDVGIAAKKREMASDAASSSEGAQKTPAKEEFTQEDRRYMKEWNISEDGMRAAKEKLKSGAMRIL